MINDFFEMLCLAQVASGLIFTRGMLLIAIFATFVQLDLFYRTRKALRKYWADMVRNHWEDCPYKSWNSCLGYWWLKTGIFSFVALIPCMIYDSIAGSSFMSFWKNFWIDR